MYEIKFTHAFKKSYAKLEKSGRDMTPLTDVIDTLRKGNVLDAKYNDHALKGKYSNFRECHVKADWLLIYMKEEEVLPLTLVEPGSHSTLLNV